jgi:hypothetical protein
MTTICVGELDTGGSQVCEESRTKNVVSFNGVEEIDEQPFIVSA